MHSLYLPREYFFTRFPSFGARQLVLDGWKKGWEKIPSVAAGRSKATRCVRDEKHCYRSSSVVGDG